MKRWIHAAEDTFDFYKYYPKYESNTNLFDVSKIASMLEDEDPDTAEEFRREFSSYDEISCPEFISWLSEFCKEFAYDDDDRAEMMKTTLRYTPW